MPRGGSNRAIAPKACYRVPKSSVSGRRSCRELFRVLAVAFIALGGISAAATVAQAQTKPARHDAGAGFSQDRNLHRQQLLLLQQRPAQPSCWRCSGPPTPPTSRPIAPPRSRSAAPASIGMMSKAISGPTRSALIPSTSRTTSSSTSSTNCSTSPIMMDCSQCPIHPTLKSVFTEYAKKDSDIVRAKGAKPVFFMSWAYADKPEMTAQLAEAYTIAGNDNNALVIPAGLAFAKAVSKQPELNLYAIDKRHPSAGRHLSRVLRGVCGADRALAGRQHLSRRHRRADRGVPAERGVGHRAGILREVEAYVAAANCSSLRAKRSNPSLAAREYGLLRRFAPRNDADRARRPDARAAITPCASPLPSAGPAR